MRGDQKRLGAHRKDRQIDHRSELDPHETDVVLARADSFPGTPIGGARGWFHGEHHVQFVVQALARMERMFVHEERRSNDPDLQTGFFEQLALCRPGRGLAELNMASREVVVALLNVLAEQDPGIERDKGACDALDFVPTVWPRGV